MTTPELLEFIRIEHALGMSLAEITRLLVTEGEWDREDVAEAFRALGLPEEQAEEGYDQKNVAPPQSSDFASPVAPVTNGAQLELTQSSAPFEAQEPVVRHAPAPVSAPGPKDMEYPRHAAPMQYVEKPEEKPKPTLARPASLKPQAFRPMVRSTQNGMEVSAAQKHAHSQHGPTIHVSKLQHLGADTKHGPAPVPQIHKSKESIETKVVFGLDVPDDEPTPKKVVSPLATEILEPHAEIALSVQNTQEKEKISSDLSVQKTGPTSAVAIEKVQVSESHGTERKAEDSSQADEVLPKFDLASALLKQDGHADTQDDTSRAIEHPVADTVSDSVVIEEKGVARTELPISPIDANRQSQSLTTPSVDTQTPILNEKPHDTQEKSASIETTLHTETSPTHTEAPSSVEIHHKEEGAVEKQVHQQGDVSIGIPRHDTAPQSPLPAGTVVPQQQPPVVPVAAQPPPPPVAPQPQIIVVPANMFGAPQGFQFPEMPMQMAGMQPRLAPASPPTQYVPGSRVAEMNGVSPDVEEQAYLAQFGQAPMPQGIERPPQATIVSPTIIYAPQVNAPAMSTQQPVAHESILPPKPEPVRFDIGKVRSTQKSESPKSALRDSVESALASNGDLSDSHPVVSPIIKPDEEQIAAAAAHSLKVPQKRTMHADLLRIGEGVIPEQVVALGDKTDAVAGVALSDTEAFEQDSVPPPPQKKVSASIFFLAMSILLVLGLIFGIGYYIVVLKKPSAQSALSGALRGLFQDGAFSYNAVVQIHASSTDALLESLTVQANVMGTVVGRANMFEKSIHEGEFIMTQRGVPEPIHIEFQGSIIGQEKEVFLSQQKPTLNTPIEHLLPVSEWLRVPYAQLGEMLGFSGATESYDAVISETQLFQGFMEHFPIVARGPVTEISEGDRVLYRIPVSLDGGKMITLSDLVSRMLRGSTVVGTDSARRDVLLGRYDMISGELVVDKLKLHPIRLTLQSAFDPSKIPFQGNVLVDIAFQYPKELPVFDRNTKTIDEYKILHADASEAGIVIAKDSPVLLAVPTIVTALKQFSEKEGYYPLRIDQLFTLKYVNSDAIPQEIRSRILYAPYARQPKEGESFAACVAKKGMCSFYHLGTTLEHMRAQELQTDVDLVSSKIQGGDTSGCAGEQSRACYDVVGILE